MTSFPRRCGDARPLSMPADDPTRKDLSLVTAVLAPAYPAEHPGGGLAIHLGCRIPARRAHSTGGPARNAWDSREAGILRPVAALCGDGFPSDGRSGALSGRIRSPGGNWRPSCSVGAREWRPELGLRASQPILPACAAGSASSRSWPGFRPTAMPIPPGRASRFRSSAHSMNRGVPGHGSPATT